MSVSQYDSNVSAVNKFVSDDQRKFCEAAYEVCLVTTFPPKCAEIVKCVASLSHNRRNVGDNPRKEQ